MEPPSWRPLFGSTALFAEDAHGTCPFYLKIGACRHGDQCSRHHVRPTSSQTLLLQHLYPIHSTRAGVKIASGEPWDDTPQHCVRGELVPDKAKHASFKRYLESLRWRFRVAQEKGIVLGRKGEVLGRGGAFTPLVGSLVGSSQLLQQASSSKKRSKKSENLAIAAAASFKSSSVQSEESAEKGPSHDLLAQLESELPPIQINQPAATVVLSEYDAQQRHLEEFYDEVWGELSSYGEIEDMIVADNVSEHMLGNVYVKYFTDEDAEKALQKLVGRWYAGRPIKAEFSPVTDFREARCRAFHEARCNRGGYCNFLHVKHIPRANKKRVVLEMYEDFPHYSHKRERVVKESKKEADIRRLQEKEERVLKKMSSAASNTSMASHNAPQLLVPGPPEHFPDPFEMGIPECMPVPWMDLSVDLKGGGGLGGHGYYNMDKGPGFNTIPNYGPEKGLGPLPHWHGKSRPWGPGGPYEFDMGPGGLKGFPGTNIKGGRRRESLKDGKSKGSKYGEAKVNEKGFDTRMMRRMQQAEEAGGAGISNDMTRMTPY